jgi:hypothetical protein
MEINMVEVQMEKDTSKLKHMTPLHQAAVSDYVEREYESAKSRGDSKAVDKDRYLEGKTQEVTGSKEPRKMSVDAEKLVNQLTTQYTQELLNYAHKTPDEPSKPVPLNTPPKLETESPSVKRW